MKKIVVIITIITALSAYGVEKYVFSKDGTNVLSGARELPSAGIRLDTKAVVIGLHASSDEIKIACGWYKCIKNNEVTPEGKIAGHRKYVISDNYARQIITWEDAPTPEPRQISKYKLLVNLKSEDFLDAFLLYLNADSERKLLWDASITLQENNELVTNAISHLKTSLDLTNEQVTLLITRSIAE